MTCKSQSLLPKLRLHSYFNCRITLTFFGVTSCLELISFICIIIKKHQHHMKHKKEIKFNNSFKNKSLMSPMQYVFAILIVLVSVAPMLIISQDQIRAYPWLGTFRETTFQLGLIVIVPSVFFCFNKNARTHVKNEFWENAPDWLFQFNPDRVEEIELNPVHARQRH